MRMRYSALKTVSKYWPKIVTSSLASSNRHPRFESESQGLRISSRLDRCSDLLSYLPHNLQTDKLAFVINEVVLPSSARLAVTTIKGEGRLPYTVVTASYSYLNDYLSPTFLAKCIAATLNVDFPLSAQYGLSANHEVPKVRKYC